MLRAIREIKPSWVVGENVRGLINWGGGLVFDEVQTDLEAEGYEVLPFLLPACAVNAPHRRDRVWFVAYSKSARTGQDIGGVRSLLERCDKWEKNESFTINTNNKGGSTRLGQVQSENGKISEWYNDAESSNANNRDASNTNTSRIYEQHIASKSNEKKQHSGTSFERRSFSAFPTKPPVCGGDDGISRELDGITFSKWRNESIKAYGNAIVPQVAYEIFKTIKQIEHEKRNPRP
jgi:DNA (cytosine-5)-methyltransferase 1